MSNVFSIYAGTDPILTIDDTEKLEFSGNLDIRGGQIINSYKEISDINNVILECDKYTVFYINNLGSRTIYLVNAIPGETYNIQIDNYDSITFDKQILFFTQPSNIMELFYTGEKWIGI